MIIERPSIIDDILSGKWIMIYGRRKTGKTFIVTEFIDHDEFFFVKRDRTILSKKHWRSHEYETFLEIFRRVLSGGGTVVVDEFHRLGEDFLDQVHSMDMNGKLILISSTLHLSHSLISASSPILGKVMEVQVPLISFQDLLKSTDFRGKVAYEMLAFMKEPIVIAQEYQDIVSILRGSKLTVPALVGEIFNEEDRKNTSIYDGVLRAVSVGKQTSGEISSYIFSRKLISRDDPSLIQQYISNLIDIGLLKKLPVWKKRKSVYKHTSPLVWSYYCLDERYSIGEREVSREELKQMVDELVPLIMEDILREALGRKLGMKTYIDLSPQDEIDGILTRFDSISAVVEVKWKNQLKNSELNKIKKKFENYRSVKKILIIPDKTHVNIEGFDVLDPGDLV